MKKYILKLREEEKEQALAKHFEDFLKNVKVECKPCPKGGEHMTIFDLEGKMVGEYTFTGFNVIYHHVPLLSKSTRKITDGTIRALYISFLVATFPEYRQEFEKIMSAPISLG